MKIVLSFCICFVLINVTASAQPKTLHTFLESQVGVTTKNIVPFWMRSNQYGSVPLSGGSVSLIAGAHIDYDTVKKRFVDWGVGFEGRTNTGNRSNFTLIEGYGKLKLGSFELRAGRSKEIMGLVDSTLSSGAFSVSGNAIGIPKVQISVPEYTHLLGGKLFAFKGNFAHGWIGEVPIRYLDRGDETVQSNTYFHQSSLYMRLGKPDWRLKLYGGINHQVFWGEQKTLSEYKLNSVLETYLYVITGKTANNFSKVGNHLGSVDVGFQYEFPHYTLFVYRQNFYDVGALANLSNIKDGLNGISIVNKAQTNSKFRWKKVLFEMLFTKNQAGYPTSKKTKSGDEDYYNNYVYKQGWIYNQENIGSPFLTTRTTARRNLESIPGDYFINNRVLAFQTGIEGSVKQLHFIGKLSYSRNYGTFGTSIYGHSLGSERFPPKVIFKEVQQFSSYLEANKQLKSGVHIGMSAAFDYGKLLENSVGVMWKVSKDF